MPSSSILNRVFWTRICFWYPYPYVLPHWLLIGFPGPELLHLLASAAGAQAAGGGPTRGPCGVLGLLLAEAQPQEGSGGGVQGLQYNTCGFLVGARGHVVQADIPEMSGGIAKVSLVAQPVGGVGIRIPSARCRRSMSLQGFEFRHRGHPVLVLHTKRRPCFCLHPWALAGNATSNPA
jgi:hypothetical protein